MRVLVRTAVSFFSLPPRVLVARFYFSTSVAPAGKGSWSTFSSIDTVW
jgi:hypothetical protein